MTNISSAIHVQDFGAFPNDGKDHSMAIQNAIEAALKTSNPVVEFDPGEYIVTRSTRISPYNDRKVCLAIDGANSGFTLRGALNAEGKPATFLIYNEPGPRYSIDYWLWISRSKDVIIENLVIDFPSVTASGKITRIADGKTWVELLPEVVKPEYFLKGAEYIFLYDLETGDMLSEKITLGGGWNEAVPEENLPEARRTQPWASLTDGHGFVLDTEIGEVGMGLAYPVQWHHAPERTMLANQVENLTLRNIVLVQAMGHVLLPVGCKNITVQNLRFDPGGRGTNRGWTSRRDGLTMRACRGNLLVEDSIFQCTSDDMLAFWGFQFKISKIISPTRIVIESKQGGGDYFLDFPLMIEAGDWIEFRKPIPGKGLPLSGIRSTIKASEFQIDRNRRMPWHRFFADEIEKESYVVSYELELNEPIPEFIHEADQKMVVLGFTLFDNAIIRRVTTRNVTNHPGVLIAGAMDFLIEDCHFGTEVEMNANDGSRYWHGAAGIWNAVIRRNTFTNSPVVLRKKGIDASTIYSLVPPRGHLLIEDNVFLNDATLLISGSHPTTIRNNTFVTVVEAPLIVEPDGGPHPEIVREGNKTIDARWYRQEE